MKTQNSFLNSISKSFELKSILYSIAGLGLLLEIWQIGAMSMHQIIIASPSQAFGALLKMSATDHFWQATWITTQRALISIMLGGAVGLLLGILSGLNKNIQKLFEPIRWMVMTISPIIVVVIAMLWFGMGTQMVITIASVLLAPIIYVNTIKGIEMVDDNLIEMAKIYQFTPGQKLWHIYLPALSGPLSAAMTLVITAGIRMIIMAEVLGASSGIGYELSFASTDMNTPVLFAWVIVSLIFVGIAEYGIFKPIESYLLRWKNA